MQVSFTPEFAVRLRSDLRFSDSSLHNPHGGGNTYALERALGQDMLLTSVGWANSYYANEVFGNGAESYTDNWGVGWRNAPYQTRFGPGFYTEIAGHPLSEAADIDSYRAPDPQRDPSLADAGWLVSQYGSEYFIVGVTVCTIFETAWALRGLERLLMDFIEDPDLADRILDIPYRYHLAAARCLVEMGVDMIWTGDDVGAQHGMLISPPTWRRFLKPRMAELISTLKDLKPTLKVAYHSDGNIEPIIPELIEIGVDVLNPVQPRCMEPARLKQQYGDRLCFWGTIDEQHTLPFGSPDDVRTEVSTRLAEIGSEGGLILGPTHHVQLDTPLENFWAMIDTITGTGKRATSQARALR